MFEHQTDNGTMRMSQQVGASHTQVEPKKKIVEPREALINDAVSFDACLLLGVSETLRLLSPHLFSSLCVRVLNAVFSSGTVETLPFSPLLMLLPFSDVSALLSSLARLPRGSLPGGASAPQSNMVCLTRSSILTRPLVGSVLRCQYLLQRQQGASLFHLWDITPSTTKMIRDLWSPRFCAGWEMPACFYPRVQLQELHVVGASVLRILFAPALS